MITGEIIERIQSLYSKGVNSDDTRLSNRHIYNKMVTVRSVLLSQKSSKNQIINDWNYSILPCVELIRVEAHECPCLPSVGCKVLRTKHPLPKPITNLNTHLIDWILSLDGSIKFDKRTREGQRKIKGNKYTKDRPGCVLENNHAYFYGKDLPKFVKIKMLADNPLEVEAYPTYCETEDCQEGDCTSILEKEFPLDSVLTEALVEIASEELVIKFSQMKEDLSNNSIDSSKEESK